MRVPDKLRACASGGDVLKELGVCDTGYVIDNASQAFGTKPHYSKELFLAIADAIDAEESGVRSAAYEEGYNAAAADIDANQEADEKELRDFCERLNELADAREEVDLFGQAYVSLPLDADGKPIRIGDVVTEWEGGHTFTVNGFIMRDGEWWVFHDTVIQKPAHKCHPKPTATENLLRRFALACEDAGNAGPEVMRLAKEYAERLQIKEAE